MIPKIPVLDPSRHKEDTVREEVLAPILKALGYGLNGEHRVERSIRLRHPYIMSGSRRFPLTLIPDYLLYRYGKPFCIIDAKAPTENVYEGDNVQQAFGYSIHPEVRVQLFCLCNGVDLAIHHVSTETPPLKVELSKIRGHWPNIVRMIGTDGCQDDLLPEDFYLDYGVFNEKLGFNHNAEGKKVLQFFQFVHFANLRRARDDMYVSHTVVTLGEDQELLMTLVFDSEKYLQLLNILPSEVSAQLDSSMKQWPYDCAINTPNPIYISISGQLDDEVYVSDINKFDRYRPLLISEVIKNTTSMLT